MLSFELVVLASVLFASTNGIKCYHMLSGKSGDLGTELTCDSSYYWCAKVYDDAGDVGRVCGGDLCVASEAGCQDFNRPDLPAGSKYCCCNTDLCNSSVTMKNSILLLMLTVFVSLAYIVNL
jgi:hypothetical protein